MTDDNLSSNVDDLHPEEAEKLDKFLDEMKQLFEVGDGCRQPLTKPIALKFLLARKLDIKRALELYRNHQQMRMKEGLSKVNLMDEFVQRELFSPKFTILMGREQSGAAIGLLTARLHKPYETSHQAALQSMMFQLDCALTDIHTQRCGLVFIYDMTQSKFSNFDYELSMKILAILKGSYPARLKKVLIITAPLWFRAPLKVLRLFVREKLRDRVTMIEKKHLTDYISASTLPTHLGGNADISHRQWLENCFTTAKRYYPNIDIPAKLPNESDARASFEVEYPDPAVNGSSSNVDDNDIPQPGNKRRPSDDAVADSSEDSSRKSKRVEQPDTDDVYEQPIRDQSTDSLAIQEDPRTAVLESFLQFLLTKRHSGLCQEYMVLRSESPTDSFDVAKLKENKPLNRYIDVPAFDTTRVPLSSATYINANFVDGYRQSKAYICTQGPLEQTTDHFWTMVWEQKVQVIAMMTKCGERGRNKCNCYWPIDTDEKCEYGSFQLTCSAIDEFEDYTISTILIHNNDDDTNRQVIHLQFTTWPDYGVPRCSHSFLDFLSLVRAYADDAGNTGPIVLHCSAGIGRTGSFVTIDICLRQLDQELSIDVERTVRKVRTQRFGSVQTADQYVFCHTALIEHGQREGLLGYVDWSDFFDSSS